MKRLAFTMMALAGFAHAGTRHGAPITLDGQSLVALRGDLWVDPTTTPPERARLQHDFTDAVSEVGELLGGWRTTPPQAIFCKSDACKLHFAGASRRSRVRSAGDHLDGAGWTPDAGLAIVLVRTDLGVREVLVHELIHIELGFRAHGGFVPAWFHEGAAALLAHAPECSAGSERSVDDLRRLETGPAWSYFTDLPGKLGPTYCQARDEVGAWVERNGRARLIALVDAVGKGSAFDAEYGPFLTQPTRDVLWDEHATTLHGARWESVALDGAAWSNVTMSGFHALADGMKPFSLALWMRPAADAGALAHVSMGSTGGGGWCTPFLGFDADKHVVSQVLHSAGPEPTHYTVARSPGMPPLGRWTHVAMTWAPGSFNRLYVDGVEVARTPAAGYRAAGSISPMYVTWGSSNVNGERCWQGAIAGGGFKGALGHMGVWDVELSAVEVAKLAADHP
jgi:Concanavalin A-like lectin/glucanases superfamily